VEPDKHPHPADNRLVLLYKLLFWDYRIGNLSCLSQKLFTALKYLLLALSPPKWAWIIHKSRRRSRLNPLKQKIQNKLGRLVPIFKPIKILLSLLPSTALRHIPIFQIKKWTVRPDGRGLF